MSLSSLIALLAVAAPEPIALEDGGVVDSATESNIRSLLHDARHEIRRCWEAHRKLPGKLTLRFVIQRDGSVTSMEAEVSFKSASLKNAPLSACAIGVLKRLHFNAPKGGASIVIAYPFVFSY